MCEQKQEARSKTEEIIVCLKSLTKAIDELNARLSNTSTVVGVGGGRGGSPLNNLVEVAIE